MPIAVKSLHYYFKRSQNTILSRQLFFLKENKSEFVKFLSTSLRNAGIDVIECEADADCCIAKTVLFYAKQKEGPIAAVFEDTDIAVMLLHHWKERMKDIFVI